MAQNINQPKAEKNDFLIYGSSPEKKMTNCPSCSKPILNGGVFPTHARFTIRCPWCQATLEVKIQPKIMTELLKKPDSAVNLDKN